MRSHSRYNTCNIRSVAAVNLRAEKRDSSARGGSTIASRVDPCPAQGPSHRKSRTAMTSLRTLAYLLSSASDGLPKVLQKVLKHSGNLRSNELLGFDRSVRCREMARPQKPGDPGVWSVCGHSDHLAPVTLSLDCLHWEM